MYIYIDYTSIKPMPVLAIDLKTEPLSGEY